ncbi:YadA family autotransporter adhesin (plasmid) [Serratia sp. L9]|uniref:YadA family autotransporter adhesin n=1 Tax=Serratia sp. L9 TaxID=3423946 RepID=UPI003D673B1F
MAIAQNSTDILRNSGDITSLTTNLTNITNDLNSGSVGLVQQDADTLGLTVAAATGGTAVSLAGTDGARTLSGVKAGALAVGSTDAINGSQLFATNNNVAANTANIVTHTADIAKNTGNISGLAGSLGGGAAVDADGNFVAPSYSVQGQTVGTVGDALNALNGGVNTNTAVIAQNSTDILRNSGDINSLNNSMASMTNDLNSGSVGLVKQDLVSKELTVAALSGGDSISFSGLSGSRVLSGVRAGRADEDAVNISQLKDLFAELGATDASIDAATGKISGPRYNIQGRSYNLSDSLAALDTHIGTMKTNINNAIAYDLDNNNKVTLGNVNSLTRGAPAPVTITNLAEGNVAVGSTDAVNGNQLYEVKSQVTQNTSDISDIKNNIDGITNGTVGLVQQDAETQELSVGKDKGGTTVSLAGTEGDRVLTGIANGVADNDAATVAQVKDIAVASSTVATNNSSNRVKAVATGKDSTALGGGAQSSGDNSMALGSNARATASNSVALGNDSLADRANSVSIGSLGNERQITNVARGTAGTDAVNVDQFKEGLSSLSNSTNQNFRDMGRRMDDMKDKLSAGVASAMAMGSLPQPYSADAGMMSMGGGSYNGESALAIGASKVSENGKWVTKVQGSTNTQGDFGISAGVGYQW